MAYEIKNRSRSRSNSNARRFYTGGGPQYKPVYNATDVFSICSCVENGDDNFERRVRTLVDSKLNQAADLQFDNQLTDFIRDALSIQLELDDPMFNDNEIVAYLYGNYADLLRGLSRQEISRVVSMERGLAFESHVREFVNRTEDYEFEECNKETSEYCTFKICAKPDGIDLKNNAIIEIKTRNMWQTGWTIKENELHQIFMYMDTTDTDRCIFAERGPKGDHQTKMTIIHRDEIRINNILGKLHHFTIQSRQIARCDYGFKLNFQACF